jgi:DNA-binding HxlR family transcriptional regulator
MPPRTRYSLTEAGRELEAVIAAIERWARKHLEAPVA